MCVCGRKQKSEQPCQIYFCNYCMHICELISDATNTLATNSWFERLCWTKLKTTCTRWCRWKHWEAQVTCGQLTGRRTYSKKVGQRNRSSRNERQIVQEQTGEVGCSGCTQSVGVCVSGRADASSLEGVNGKSMAGMCLWSEHGG